MKRLFVFVSLVLALSMVSPSYSDDWIDPNNGGAESVVSWVKAGFKFFVEHYQGIDLLWFNRVQ
jgi:hypothetical protein